MSSSNYRRNKAAIDQYRKELMVMLDDIQQVDKKVLNTAVNDGVEYAQRRTPIGAHPNPVTFTVKNGPDAGKIVSFEVSVPGVGGKLKENWHKLPTRRTAGGLETELVNAEEYASYWNYGHRIITKKGGPIKGFVKGTYVLEKTQNYVNRRMIALFKKELEAIQKKHD